VKTLDTFKKACPVGLCLHDRPCQQACYKYFLKGKGCTLGVLFEDSVNVYFEWLTEDGTVVDYGPDIRYKARPKREMARLIRAGVWEAETDGGLPANRVMHSS
jgi:hypothetical protein